VKAIIQEVLKPGVEHAPGFFFWPNYTSMIGAGWNPEGHPPFATEASTTWARRPSAGASSWNIAT